MSPVSTPVGSIFHLFPTRDRMAGARNDELGMRAQGEGRPTDERHRIGGEIERVSHRAEVFLVEGGGALRVGDGVTR
jgi:hypothetical protein